MSDKDATDILIQEVDDDLRQDNYKKLWQRHGSTVIGAAVALVLGVAAQQGWSAWHASKLQDESRRLVSARDLVLKDQFDAGLSALDALSKDSKTGQGLAAAFARAELLAGHNRKADASAALRAIDADSAVPAQYRDLAFLKAVMLDLDDGLPAGATDRVAAMTGSNNPWRLTAMEVQAALALKTDDKPRATSLYRQIFDDAVTPAGQRARAKLMLASLGMAVELPAGITVERAPSAADKK